jgi:hypothetical protein
MIVSPELAIARNFQQNNSKNAPASGTTMGKHGKTVACPSFFYLAIDEIDIRDNQAFFAKVNQGPSQ